MPHVSKTTADRLNISRAVVAAIQVQGAAIAASARDALGPARSDFAVLVEELGKGLRDAEAELREKDAAYLAQLTARDVARIDRDAAETTLRDTMSGAASLVAGAFGPKLVAKLGLEVSLERRADLLVSQARHAARLLPSAKLPQPKVAAARIDINEIASWVDAAAEVLAKAIEAVEHARREAERAMLARDEAALRWERVYACVADIVVGLATAAGQDELAARIRPTARRRAGFVVPEEETTEPVVSEPEPQPEPEPVDA